ncbi:hypothetical protein [Paenibacillus amylolyticus]|uniref:hypothetical protein n=1 Tax=Paenibacillus amylolyticus TaxID=1451 RepID=UPI003D961E9F
MSRCEYYEFGCVACSSGYYKSSSEVRFKGGKIAYAIKDPVITRQFCNKSPYSCIFHPNGNLHRNSKDKQKIMLAATKADQGKGIMLKSTYATETKRPNESKQAILFMMGLAAVGFLIYYFKL